MGKAVRLVRSPRTGRLRKLPAHVQEKKDVAEAKQLQAMELRKAGATYQEIADALGYKQPAGAKKAVDAVMKRTVFDLAEDIVTLDLQRLDEFQKRCMHQLRTKGDLSQIDRLMRIMERRYMLAGVAPETVKKIQEAYGLDGAVINNAGVMVVQVGHNSEQEFVKKMMLASGVDLESQEAKHYLERVDLPKELEAATQEEPAPTPRRTVKGKKVRIVRKRKPPESSRGTGKEASEKAPIEGVHIGGSNKGVSIGHPLLPSTHTELIEEEIIDAEIVEPEVRI